jgi:tyrosyl-tRNA synthetase
MGLARLQLPHAPIAIVGGGTGMIGDPSGKSQERVRVGRADRRQRRRDPRFERFLDSTPGTAAASPQHDWLARSI